MDILLAFRLYTALRLHFTSAYDITKYGGKVPGCNMANVNKNPQRKYLIERMARRFVKPNDLVQYVVAQYAYAQGTAIYDPMIADENYTRWEKNRMATTQNMLDDLHQRDIPALISGEPPEILKLVLRGEIRIETAVALNGLLNFNDKDYFGFGEIGGIINKLARFVQFDRERIEKEFGLSHDPA